MCPYDWHVGGQCKERAEILDAGPLPDKALRQGLRRKR